MDGEKGTEGSSSAFIEPKLKSEEKSTCMIQAYDPQTAIDRQRSIHDPAARCK